MLLLKLLGDEFVSNLYFVTLKFLVYELIADFSPRINFINRLLIDLWTQFRFFVISDLYLKTKSIRSGGVPNVFLQLLEEHRPL